MPVFGWKITEMMFSGAMHLFVPTEIVKRQVAQFYSADPDYGIGVATRMGLSVTDLPSAVAAE
jgi:hypothetical protein